MRLFAASVNDPFNGFPAASKSCTKARLSMTPIRTFASGPGSVSLNLSTTWWKLAMSIAAKDPRVWPDLLLNLNILRASSSGVHRPPPYSFWSLLFNSLHGLLSSAWSRFNIPRWTHLTNAPLSDSASSTSSLPAFYPRCYASTDSISTP